MLTLYRRLVVFIGSKVFFVIVMVVFLASAVLIAFSSRYPMAFDESYHLGLIKLHAAQWSPIFTHQPVGVAQYGALTRDPSYLYHYFMSFPYRILNATHASLMRTVVTLRLINVALFAVSLPVFRTLLLKTKASPAIVHLALLFFVLTPVVPLLAATINYDNLQTFLVAYTLLLTIYFREQLLARKFNIDAFGLILIISMLASLVKFTYLPIFLALIIYLPYLLIRYGLKHNLPALIKKSWQTVTPARKAMLVFLMVVSSILFAATYGVNMIKYQNPVPQCGQVLDVQRCSAYAPWNRNYLAALSNNGVDPNPIKYTANWLGGMFDRLFFTINGHAVVADSANSLAPIMSIAVVVIAVVGLILASKYGLKILRNDGVLSALLFTSFVYICFVFGRNYHDYLHLGKITAVNGRYLIPILLPIYVFLAQCYQLALVGRAKLKLWLVSLSTILILQGGGATSFIYYSTSDWYWPGNKQVQRLNQDAKNIINPFFITWYLKK
jgi:hypothetical protein